MTGRRKGTPCACETDPCSCGSSKGKCVRAVNNVSPDPNGDFNIKAGTGIAISNGPDNEITIINSANPNAFVEGDNIDLIPSGDDIEIALTQNPVINGTLTVNGDIIQNGAAYETHAEKIYTRDDYIIMRDGAIAALAPGDYAGFQVKLYDGVNDGRLVIDSSGTARVGDVGDEQPLLTREESANLTNGALFKWDAVNSKAVDEGTVGTDTKPIKIVNGVATPVPTVLVATPSGSSQIVNGRLYFPSYDIVGSRQDVNRNDMHIDAYNPTTNTISRIVVTMRNDGVAQIILEKWNAALDANGNPYASSFISGTSIGTTS